MSTSPEKLKIGRDASMVQGQVFLKGGWEGWHFSYLVFLRFIIFTFNHSTLCKTIFFATIIFGKKVILNSLKMNQKTSHKLR